MLADGREIEMHRFSERKKRGSKSALPPEKTSPDYERQRNGEVLFALFHLGIPKDPSESASMIRENKVAEIHGYGTIRVIELRIWRNRG